MDYQCECGEEFDVFDQFSTNWHAEQDACSIITAFYTIKCPKCGKKYQVQEEYEYKGATVYAQ